MTTKPRSRRRAPNGFTLVEVLAAFMILAVGLLALEALGIGAARLVARSERMSEYNTEALSRLEQTLSQLRMGQTPAATSYNLRNATMLVSPSSAAGGRYWTVRVTVRPVGDRVLAASDSFTVSGHVLLE